MSITPLQAFSATVTVLFIKIFVTIWIQGGKAFAAGTRPPEDSSLMAGQPKQSYGLVLEDGDQAEAVLMARDVDVRWRRIVQNDLENIPIGLLVILSSVLVGANKDVNEIAMAVFAVMRILHTIAYAYEKQPARTITWMLAIIAVLVSGLNGFFSFVL